MLKNNLNLIAYELKNGILFKWQKYVPIAAISFIFCMFFFTGVTNVAHSKDMTATPTFMDYIVYLFAGMSEYNPDSNKPFEIPIVWFVINFYIATVIANYPSNDICGFGRTVLLQNKNRTNWFFNKCVWVTASVTVCFMLIYAAPFLIALFTGGLSMNASSSEPITMMLEGNSFLPKRGLAITAMLLPFLTSVAVSLIQLTLEFILKPVYSYMTVMCFWIISAYFCSPVVFGNNSMILRSEYFNNKGVNWKTACVICASVIIAASVCGLFRFKRYDIIDKG